MTDEEQEGANQEPPPRSSSSSPTPTPLQQSSGPSEAQAAPAKTNAGASSPVASSSGDNNGGDSPDDLLPPNLHNPSLYGTVSFWSEFTSIHGVYYLFERGHLTAWKQIVWGILCAGVMGGLIWALQEEIRDFKKFSKSSEHKTIIPQSLAFPQVTICNTNRWDVSRQNVSGIEEPQNEEEVNLISQPLEEFILDTSFNGIPYDKTNPEEVWTPVITPFGRCFMFTSEEKIFVPGPTAGLLVHLWLNQSNYEETTPIAGVSVFVTQKGSVVTSQTDRDLVPPGSASFLAVSLYQFQREEREPWRNCDGYTPEYSNQLCRNNCIQKATRQKCNCRLLGDGTSSTTSTTSPLRYCNSTDEQCTRSIFDEEDELDEECKHCSIPPCREEEYVSSYSSAKIATKAANSVEAIQGLDPGEIAQNFVSIDINYATIRYEERTESRSTSFSQLLSNLGGSMGFFMGISMISVLELFGELMILRILPRFWGDRRLYGLGQKED